jgi:flagellar hook-length control protein FliK
VIQSSPQSHAAEALLGGSAPRTAALKAKRNGLANLFSSLLTEARGRIDAATSGGAGKPKVAASGTAEGKKPVSRHSGASAAVPTTVKRSDEETASRLLAKQGPLKASTQASAAEQTAAQAFASRQGHQATAAASKASESDRKAAEDAGTERTEGSKKALLAKRRVGFMDGSNGGEGSEQLAALSLAGAQRNVSMPKQKMDGAIDSDQKKVETAETKKKDKRKDRLELELYDHRTGSAADPAQTLSKTDAPSASDRKAASEADLVVNLRSGNAERGNGEDGQRPGAAPHTSFSDALARELRENANADIVKHASLVLKDGGEGLLRLSLKPDSLGAVKIRLEMADNKIAGHILVESEEALKAFEKELASLEQAFRDGGFDGASLELGVSSDGAKGGNGNPNADGGPRPFFSERLASSTYDASITAADSRPATTENESLVNVLV